MVTASKNALCKLISWLEASIERSAFFHKLRILDFHRHRIPSPIAGTSHAFGFGFLSRESSQVQRCVFAMLAATLLVQFKTPFPLSAFSFSCATDRCTRKLKPPMNPGIFRVTRMNPQET